ncbi:MAG: hypothetical protein HY321_21470 [Armatimonadetes bacterium]|nr:hypothetical protein [Armatimonadota bacterium]
MKKIHRAVPDVPQAVADQGCDILERYFNRYGVTRAMQLPENVRVDLMHELRAFYTVELTQEWLERAIARANQRSWWQRFLIWWRELLGIE